MIQIGFIRGEGFFGCAAATVGSYGCFQGSASKGQKVLIGLLALSTLIANLLSPQAPLKSQKYD